MGNANRRSLDAKVEIVGDSLYQQILSATLILLVPILAGIIWIVISHEPALKYQVTSTVGQQTVAQRAAAIESLLKGIAQRAKRQGEALNNTGIAGLQDPLSFGFPEAKRLRIIRLDAMGTANLSPGEQGLESNVDIDLVRKAFNGETPWPEAVAREDGVDIVLATGFGDQAKGGGVILMALSPEFLTDILAPVSGEGRYNLIQAPGSSRQIIIAGENTPKGLLRYENKVGTTNWIVRFQPSANWMDQLNPNFYLWVTMGCVVLLAVMITALILTKRIPAVLNQEVKDALSAVENGNKVELAVPALEPLIKMLIQLQMVTRRQISQAARMHTEDFKRDEVAGSASIDPEEDEAPLAPLPEEADDGPPEAPLERLTPVQQRAPEPPRAAVVEAPSADGIPEHIFRESDIRGLVSSDLTEELVTKIAYGIAVRAKANGISTLIVGHDNRPSSEAIRANLVKHLMMSGIDVVDAGVVPTPVLYFATHESEFDSAVMVTGGHSGSHVNGFRIIFKRQTLDREELSKILDCVRQGETESGTGRTIKRDFSSDYIEKLSMDTGVALPLKVAVDAGGGAAGKMVGEMMLAIGCEVVTVNTNPGRGMDRTLGNALEDLGRFVLAETADIGVLFDSDGDRAHFVDNNGQVVDADRAALLLVGEMLERNPGADIVFDAACSRIFAPTVTRDGGRALMAKSGHANLVKKVVETNALMGVDFAGHFVINERWYPFDDGLYTAARILELMSATGDSFADSIGALPKTVSSALIEVPVADSRKRQIVKQLEEEFDFSEARTTHIDGLRIDFSDSWGIVRPSSTTSAIELRFEAQTEEGLNRVRDLLEDALTSIEPDLELG